MIGLTKKVFLVTSWTEIYDVIMMSKYLISRRPRVVIFTEIIKIVTMFIKTIFKDSKKKKKKNRYKN